MQPKFINQPTNIEQRCHNKRRLRKASIFWSAILWIALLFAPMHPMQAQEILRHEVQVGETLSGIADYYAVPMADLMIFNKIQDANAIYLGQTLYLPPAARVPEKVNNSTEGKIVTDTVILDRVTSDAQPTNSVTATFALTNTLPASLDIISAPTSVPLIFTSGNPPLVIVKPTPAWSVDRAAVVISSTVTRVVPTTTPVPERPVVLSPEEQLVLDQMPAVDTMAMTANLNKMYRVKSGDTLPLIALRTGVDYKSLLLLNRMEAEDTANLYVGQKLLLPATDTEFYQSYAAEEEETYTVKAGDTLGGIADKYEVPWSLLLEANRLRNANAIYEGQTLTIPKLPSDTVLLTNRQNPWPPIGPSQRGFNYYTVQRGDTLSSIAEDLGTTQLALVEFNGLPDTETVFLGMELRVPYGPPPLPVRTPPVPTSGTAFLVSMSRQQCWVFQGQNVVEEWVCSTGYGEWISRTGTFAVQTKQENAKSAAYRLDMPYWLGIYDVGDFENGIHGLPVRWDSGEKIWSEIIGQPATFGCAMLTDEDAKALFDLSYIGMPVYIMQ